LFGGTAVQITFIELQILQVCAPTPALRFFSALWATPQILLLVREIYSFFYFLPRFSPLRYSAAYGHLTHLIMNLTPSLLPAHQNSLLSLPRSCPFLLLPIWKYLPLKPFFTLCSSRPLYSMCNFPQFPSWIIPSPQTMFLFFCGIGHEQYNYPCVFPPPLCLFFVKSQLTQLCIGEPLSLFFTPPIMPCISGPLLSVFPTGLGGIFFGAF